MLVACAGCSSSFQCLRRSSASLRDGCAPERSRLPALEHPLQNVPRMNHGPCLPSPRQPPQVSRRFWASTVAVQSSSWGEPDNRGSPFAPRRGVHKTFRSRIGTGVARHHFPKQDEEAATPSPRRPLAVSRRQCVQHAADTSRTESTWRAVWYPAAKRIAQQEFQYFISAARCCL